MSDIEKDIKNYERGDGDVTVSVSAAPAVAVEDDVKIDVHTHIYDGVQRKMEQRHMQMIALAGTLGTGLFLGSGKAIANGGPLGALLAYVHISTVVYSMMMCIGEMAVFAPISGGYLHFAERWFHPSVGFALGWQCVFSHIVSLPTEIISASILISFWDTDFPLARQGAYILVILVLSVAINFFGVRWFGESEFIFAMIKICLIVGLILAGVIVDLGGGPMERIGFRYWKDPGAFVAYRFAGSTGNFLGWFTDLLQAAYSFLGMENIAIAAAEVKNPRVSVTKAIKRIFIRIVLFYICGIIVVGMLVPSNDKSLLHNTGTAASSPYVIAFNRAGIKVLPSIINAGVLTSAFSAANSGLYGGSRMLYSLSLRGHAPRIFSRTTSKGLPFVALSAIALFSPLCFMALGPGASTALNWLSNLTSLAGFITWGTIAATYLRFKKGVEAQGMDRKSFHYHGFFQPWPAYWVLLWCSTVIIFNGWQVFTKGHWNVSNFFVAYINIPIFLLLIAGHWLIKRPKHLSPDELDFVSNIPSDEEVSYEEPPPKNAFAKVMNFLFT